MYGATIKDKQMIEIHKTKDYHLLAGLNKEVQTFHHQIFPSIFKPYNQEAITCFFKDAVESEDTVAYLAMENGTAIGYALLFVTNFSENPFQYSRKSILLDQILVLTNHRSKGVGRQLLEAAFSFARSTNIDRVELNHWTQNASARKFFNENGFEYYNEKMWKTIA